MRAVPAEGALTSALWGVGGIVRRSATAVVRMRMKMAKPQVVAWVRRGRVRVRLVQWRGSGSERRECGGRSCRGFRGWLGSGRGGGVCCFQRLPAGVSAAASGWCGSFRRVRLLLPAASGGRGCGGCVRSGGGSGGSSGCCGAFAVSSRWSSTGGGSGSGWSRGGSRGRLGAGWWGCGRGGGASGGSSGCCGAFAQERRRSRHRRRRQRATASC